MGASSRARVPPPALFPGWEASSEKRPPGLPAARRAVAKPWIGPWFASLPSGSWEPFSVEPSPTSLVGAARLLEPRGCGPTPLFRGRAPSAGAGAPAWWWLARVCSPFDPLEAVGPANVACFAGRFPRSVCSEPLGFLASWSVSFHPHRLAQVVGCLPSAGRRLGMRRRGSPRLGWHFQRFSWPRLRLVLLPAQATSILGMPPPVRGSLFGRPSRLLWLHRAHRASPPRIWVLPNPWSASLRASPPFPLTGAGPGVHSFGTVLATLVPPVGFLPGERELRAPAGVSGALFLPLSAPFGAPGARSLRAR